MKFVKWKILFITSALCLLPILLGIAVWNDLPDKVAIHFNFYNEADSFASKGFAVFALPLIMAFFQALCSVMADYNCVKHEESQKIVTVTKWIIPTVTVLLQAVILGYSLGYLVDIRKAAVFIVSAEFLVLGSCIGKLDYIKNYKLDKDKAGKINKFVGFQMVIMGILGVITIFLPPVVSIWWLFLLIPCVLIGIIYGIIVVRKK